MWVRQPPNYFHKCFKHLVSLASLGRKRGYVAPGQLGSGLGAHQARSGQKPPGRVFVTYSGNSDWMSGPVRATVVFMPERYISDVMRIIEPAATTHASDEPIINTWLRNQRSEHTRGVYRRDTAKLLRFTGKPLRAITLDDLQAFSADLARQGLAPISVGRTLAAVRSLMRFANRSGHLAKNVAADLNLPRSEKRLPERILREEDVQRMIALETEPRNRVLMLLLYTAGLRVSEACNLRWRNLRTRGDTGQLTIFGKGGKTWAILLPAAMWQDLLSASIHFCRDIKRGHGARLRRARKRRIWEIEPRQA